MCCCHSALPKERSRHKSRVNELSKQLQQKVDQYAKLLPYGRKRDRQATSLQELLVDRSFRWVNEYEAGVDLT